MFQEFACLTKIGFFSPTRKFLPSWLKFINGLPFKTALENGSSVIAFHNNVIYLKYPIYFCEGSVFKPNSYFLQKQYRSYSTAYSDLINNWDESWVCDCQCVTCLISIQATQLKYWPSNLPMTFCRRIECCE